MQNTLKEITPSHFEALKRDFAVNDDRALKELTAFLIVFGEPLCKRLQNETGNETENELLTQSWSIANEIGGAFSEKLKAFKCPGFKANFFTWNQLAGKYSENNLRSYTGMVDSLLVAYGV